MTKVKAVEEPPKSEPTKLRQPAENTAAKQRKRGKPFPKGTSGNPKGRPSGARNRATVIAQALLDGEAEALTAKAVQLALEGDVVALRLCLERLIPPRREAPVSLTIPSISTAADAVNAMSAIVNAAGKGEITPGEAAAFAGLIETWRKSVETADLEQRIAALEERAVIS